MNAEEFDVELLKRLKGQRKLLEDTALNMPLPPSSLNGKRCDKIAKKKVKKNESPKKRK